MYVSVHLQTSRATTNSNGLLGTKEIEFKEKKNCITDKLKEKGE
jgi:hypothetical protein